MSVSERERGRRRENERKNVSKKRINNMMIEMKIKLIGDRNVC